MQRLLSANNSYRLVQVTDTHLYADTSHVLVGMNCEEGLQDVMALIRKKEKVIAGVLLTGDASQDNSAMSYRRLHATLATLGARQHWIPGNHDELKAMQRALDAGNRCFDKSIRFGKWLVLMLSSNVVGAVHGFLKKAELDFLDEELSNTAAEHVLVCLHHNPVPVKAAWLQHHALQNPTEFFKVIDRYPAVRAVLFGHIHHVLKKHRNGVAYYGSPSTCIQFHPRSEDFALDHRNPGYRWLELHGDGQLLTGVNRVTNKSYSVDFSGIGY
ncbi:MAG: 3',5'-cyclic-AMP phosphodiesterase [Gammaproteobacteria bacterium]|jgi:Icc protein